MKTLPDRRDNLLSWWMLLRAQGRVGPQCLVEPLIARRNRVFRVARKRGQFDSEHSTPSGIVFSADLSAMRFNNRAGYGKSKPHAFFFRRNKRMEYVRQDVVANPVPLVEN